MSTTSSTSNLPKRKQKPSVVDAPVMTPKVEDPNTKKTLKGDEIVVDNTDRHTFKGIEFLLSVMGLAVGLGNIWRFPTIVYENGGSVFLIPYLVCTVLFAIPAVHMEFCLGQFHARSPPAVFRRMAPILEGMGWMSCILGAIIGIYYMVLLSWIVVYLVNFRSAGSISKCTNSWNDNSTCYDGSLQKLCLGPNPAGFNVSTVPGYDPNNRKVKLPKLIYMAGRCQEAAKFKTLEGGTEQFFTRYLVTQSSGLLDFNSFNWYTFAALLVCWIGASIILLRGMKMIGKMSYFTVICPYVIIVALLIRGLLLDGATDGLRFFFRPTDFSALYSYKTWSAALTQLCFSLSIGIGCLMNTASYNKKTHNWYRDVYLLILSDQLMSILGGAAVFSTLGFLAKQRGVTVHEVIATGHALAFIVYTEAISRMPVPEIWYILFFTMLLCLGFSTELVFVEVVCSCLADRFAYLRKHRWIAVLAVSTVLMLIGLVMTTDAGYYWFDLFDEYTAGVSATLGSALTCVTVCWFYGLSNFRADVTEMWGEPQGAFSRLFGPASFVISIGWQFTSPVCSLLLMGFFIYSREYPFKGDKTKYPALFDILGWFVSLIPFMLIPVFAGAAVYWFRVNKIPFKGLFMVQKQHPSFERISETWAEPKKVIGDQLPDLEPGQELVEVMVDGSEPELKEESLIE